MKALPFAFLVLMYTTVCSASLGPADIAVVVNSRDPLSRLIGSYYVAQRHIPRGNIASVSFDYERDELTSTEFVSLKASVDRQLKSHVRAYALTWSRPYRVGCMSVTSAFALGWDEKYCATGCSPTAKSPYFNQSDAPPVEGRSRITLAISLAATNFENAKALIDRGVRSDGSAPHGTAYLVTTQDGQRNVRALEYPLAIRVAQHEFDFPVNLSAEPRSADDAMFYFVGAASPAVAGVRFRPGALADHLTSFGGMLTDSPQMSSLRWLEAGATGSYGTVVEPCNILQKFPNVPILLAHYLAGETLIEAYWKSVEMPGQGIFLGEPLAAPFKTR